MEGSLVVRHLDVVRGLKGGTCGCLMDPGSFRGPRGHEAVGVFQLRAYRGIHHPPLLREGGMGFHIGARRRH